LTREMGDHKLQSPNPFILDNAINWHEAWLADTGAQLDQRRKERTKPVHMQHTYITRSTGGNIPRIRKEIAKMCRLTPIKTDDKSITALYKLKEKKDERTMRQNNRELIESKRDIFHLEFAIRNKRNVIDNFKFKSHITCEMMNESERRLIHDSQLFDEFLHVNNEAASEAMAQADLESKKHQEKNRTIKELNAHMCEIRSHLCGLDNLQALKDEIKQFIFLVHANQLTSEEPVTQSSKEWQKAWNEIKSDDAPIPFQNASGLLESIFELEDRNLSLIGHFHQSEEEFDEIRAIFQRTAKKLDTQIAQLRSHMQLVETTAERCNARSEELKFYCSMFDCSEFNDQDAELAHFEKAIEHTYNSTTGENALEMNIDSLTMLTFIETRLEDLLEMEESLPPTRVKEEQKERDKQRRIEAREKKIQDHNEHQKERLLRALNRNNANRIRRVGRRLVARSRPFDRIKVKSEVASNNFDYEAEFLT